jgi:predicted nucleic acid-binding protein
MRAKVIDASALSAVLFSEPDHASVMERVAGARLFAPTILAFEVGNVCCTKMRRYPQLKDQFLEAFEKFNALSIESIDIDTRAVLELALDSGLTFYDASYLWLAQASGAELVTLDRKLMAALGR